MSQLTRVIVILTVFKFNVYFCNGDCIHHINETSCLDEAHCTDGYVEARQIDYYSPIWNICHNYRKSSYYLPMKLLYKDQDHDRTLEIPEMQRTVMENNLITIFDISRNNYNVFPALTNMRSLNLLDVSFNNLRTLILSSIYTFEALEELDVSHNLITEILINENEHPFSYLKRINISHNNLIKLEDAIFTDFNALQYLDLSYNNMTLVNAVTFEGIKNLLYFNLAHNNIDAINKSLFRFSQLQYLYLNNNKITNVYQDDFKNLMQLQELDLSFNLISSIEEKVFEKTPLISSINLKNNLLININSKILQTSTVQTIGLSLNDTYSPDGMFKGRNISFFDIRENILMGALKKGTFEGLNYVLELDLSHQKFTSVEDYAFIGLENVNIILLNNNQIRNLSQNSFSSLKTLIRLDLSYNRIGALNFDLLDLVKLEFLSLKNNIIKHISTSYFSHRNKLKFLDISNNNILSVETNKLFGLSRLIWLDISKNMLTGILEEEAFKGLHALPILDISESAFTMIKNNSFNDMITLHKLNISYSNVSIISFNSFINTGNIIVLDLSYNLLKIFNVNTSTLVNLNELYLDHNLIKVVSPNHISGLKMLASIRFSYNYIDILNDETFMYLNNLNDLDLSYNENIKFNITLLNNINNLQKLKLLGITNVVIFDKNAEVPITDLDMSKSNITDIISIKINYLQNLHTLTMNNNKIKRLEGAAFSNLTKLALVDLSFNNLMFIQPGIFRDNGLLKTLNISHNKLTYLSFGIFRGLEYLSTLDLSYNELQDLKSERFYGIQSLRNLIVDSNKISKIEIEEFSLHLSVLSIGDNPLSCETLMKLKIKSNNLQLNITAINLEESAHDNIDGVTCYGNIEHKNKENLDVLNGNEIILSDIRDVLINLTSKHISDEILDVNHASEHFSSKLEKLISTFNKTNNLIENTQKENNMSIELVIKFLNDSRQTTESINRNDNITNSLLERILKVIVAKQSSAHILPFFKENITNTNISMYLDKLKEEFENSLIILKENIISEVDDKISRISKPNNNTTVKSVDKNGSESEVVIQKTHLLFNDICIYLILIILLCFVINKLYERFVISRGRRSFSTQQIAHALDNSNL